MARHAGAARVGDELTAHATTPCEHCQSKGAVVCHLADGIRHKPTFSSFRDGSSIGQDWAESLLVALRSRKQPLTPATALRGLIAGRSPRP